jgi:threonine aldolase
MKNERSDLEPINLYSDTQTLPTEEMLDAIRAAELGDDTYDKDPTVKRLEEMAAPLMRKEAAILVLSGTMGNLVALMCHGRPGNEVLIDPAKSCRPCDPVEKISLPCQTRI